MPTVEHFLIDRLKNAGVQHVFGVPGEHIGGFFQKLNNSQGISLVTTTDESGAAHAADSYARIKGAGCVAVTYNVGAFKIVNAVAAANAERSPMVIVAGAPSIKEVAEGSIYEHMRRTFECQRAVFENLCCATTVLDDPVTAGYEIDRVLEALRFYKQPVYIELPKDVGDKNVSYDVYRMGTPESPKSDPENLNEALDEVIEWVNHSSNPVILAGVEVARYELGILLQKFSEKTNIPIATTLLSKSVINERHPLYLGLYNGNSSQIGVQDAVEKSDCVLMFGVMAGDAALTYMPMDLRRKNVVSATVEQLKIKNHTYKRVQFLDFVQAFTKSKVHPRSKPHICLSKDKQQFFVQPDARITSVRLFEKLNSLLDANSLIVSDTGNSMFGSSELMVHHSHSFLGHALYSSVGSAIPATVGANLARPTSRPLVILGDRAFQASCNDLGTIVAQGLTPTIIIVNNHGNGAERLTTASKLSKMPEWNYSKITEMVGGIGAEVKTEGELEVALTAAWKSDQMSVISVDLDANDHSPLLQATLGVSKKV